MKYHAILYFDTEINLGLGTHPNVWVNYKTVDYTDSKKAFCDYYDKFKNTPDQVYLVSEETPEEFEQAKKDAVEKFNKIMNGN